MRFQRLRYSKLLGAIALLFAVEACHFNRNYGYKVEVKAGVSGDEKVALAKAAASDEKIAELRRALMVRFPQLTEKQAAGISFGIQRWNSPKKDGSARVYIAVQGLYGQGFDPQPVVLAAAEILEANLSAAAPLQHSS